MCEILTELLYVHEDLVFREQTRLRAETELQYAVPEPERRCGQVAGLPGARLAWRVSVSRVIRVLLGVWVAVFCLSSLFAYQFALVTSSAGPGLRSGSCSR
jgi:hypothetical protein